jgi:3-dehydroquinate synthase
VSTFLVRSRAGHYPVRVVPGGLARLGGFARALGLRRRAVVVSDAHVAALYAWTALRSLRRAGLAAELVTVPPGECSKGRAQLEALWRTFAALEVERDHAVVALGGGVVGDLGGFAAATYLRGLPLVMAPTSVVAQIDSSIGGKVGIDLPEGKNLAGAFYPPRGVLTDPLLLGTLPERHLRAGLAEGVKVGMAVVGAVFERLEGDAGRLIGRDPLALGRAVLGCARAKGELVSRDEFEAGPRTALNYGHTVGHALEVARRYRGTLHGEGVALGMRAAARLSQRVAGLPERDRLRLETLLDRLGLPRRLPPVGVQTLLGGMVQDKKRRGGRILWVLTPWVGFASVPRPVDKRLVRAVLVELGARAGR